MLHPGGHLAIGQHGYGGRHVSSTTTRAPTSSSGLGRAEERDSVLNPGSHGWILPYLATWLGGGGVGAAALHRTVRRRPALLPA